MNSDLRRQLTVTASAIVCVYGTLLGVGVIGTRVEESSGGRLAADATLIAPATPAFSIWSVIYLGIFAYVGWQWLPRHKTDQRLRDAGTLASLSMLLNAGWLLVTQQGWLVTSVGVMLALLLTLAVLARRLADNPANSGAERLVIDGTFGLYLGWVCVATCANFAATIVGLGVSATGTLQTILTVVVLAAVVAVGFLLASRLGRQSVLYAAAAGIVWGLAWVIVGRTGDAPRNLVVAVAAALAAAGVAALTARAPRVTAPA